MNSSVTFGNVLPLFRSKQLLSSPSSMHSNKRGTLLLRVSLASWLPFTTANKSASFVIHVCPNRQRCERISLWLYVIVQLNWEKILSSGTRARNVSSVVLFVPTNSFWIKTTLVYNLKLYTFRQIYLLKIYCKDKLKFFFWTLSLN